MLLIVRKSMYLSGFDAKNDFDGFLVESGDYILHVPIRHGTSAFFLHKSKILWESNWNVEELIRSNFVRIV